MPLYFTNPAFVFIRSPWQAPTVPQSGPLPAPRTPQGSVLGTNSYLQSSTSTGGQEVDGDFSTVDSRMRLLSCLINAFYMYLSTRQLLPVLL